MIKRLKSSLKNNLHIFQAALLYVCIFVVFFSPLLFSNQLIVADGVLPIDFEHKLWSNFIFSGYPLFADPIWHTFYPLNFILYKILHLDYNVFVISSYILTAWFTYGYVYTLTHLKTAAFTSGLIFSFSGFASFEIGHAILFMHTIAWLSLILWAFEKLKHQVSIFWGLVASIAIAMSVLGGFPQLSLTIFLVIVTYATLLAFQSKHKVKKQLLLYAGLICLGYLLTAIQTLPTIILGLLSARSHISWEMFCSFFVEKKQLLLFVFPYLMGGYYGLYAKIPIFGNWEVLGNHGYVGFLSLVLTGIAIYKTPKALKSITLYWLMASFIVVLIALGPGTGFFYKVLFHIPIVNNFRVPARYLFIFSFGIATLAGIGIKSLRDGLIDTKFQKLIAGLIVCGITLIIVCGIVLLYPKIAAFALTQKILLPNFYQNPAILIPIIWISLSLFALLYWLQSPRSLSRNMLTITVLVLELLSTAYFSYWHGNSVWDKTMIATSPSYIDRFRTKLNSTHQRYWSPGDLSHLELKYLVRNYNLYNKMPNASGYTPLIIKRYQEFLFISDNGVYLGDPASLKYNQAINLLGIKYFFTGSSASSNNAWFDDAKHFTYLERVGNILVYENQQALPRAWFTHEVITVDPQTMIQIIHTGKFADGTPFIPQKTALIEKSHTFRLKEDKTAKLIIKKITSNKVIINTYTREPQFLILSDTYYPGWKAYIDKKPTAIFQTDYILRGIVVPAGEHLIEFKFQPVYFYIAVLISFLSIVFLIIFIYSFRRYL